MPLRVMRGFTLIEMVMVIVIIGVLALVAGPRLFERQSYEARGYLDQTMTTVRYAHKLAIAQRRTVHVNATVNAICLSYVADAPCTNANAGAYVFNPADNQRYIRNAPAGVSFANTFTFSFDAQGRPSAAQVINITGDGATRSFRVEVETGYVR